VRRTACLPCLPGLLDPVMYDVPQASPVARERARLCAAAERVLALLRQRSDAGATNVELSHPDVGGLRAVGRIHDLRQRGHHISKAHIKDGLWRYWLIEGEKGVETA
jgi:hypothetical protein